MEVIIKGKPKEIAALAAAMQERRETTINWDELVRRLESQHPEAFRAKEAYTQPKKDDQIGELPHTPQDIYAESTIPV